MRISKSKFVAGVQCLKRLYWQVHEPELAAEPGEAVQAIMEQGQDVGLLAQTMFRGGIEVSGEDGLDEAIRTTRELVANRQIPAIFEGTFEHRDVLVRVDILHRRRDNRWRLIEVKSTATLKEQHLDDVAIQSRVVSRAGLDLASSNLMHVNRSYVFQGGTVDPRRFFRVRNLTRQIAKLNRKITRQLRTEFRILDQPDAPDIAPGRHCGDPVTCEFYDRCNTAPPDDHIGYLPYIHASVVAELEELGIESIRDIPDDFPLNERQRRACTSIQTGKAWFSSELSAELKKLKYPLYFADFETLNPAIPRFTGMRGYDPIPFQWSVHVQRRPGAVPEHFEFLATDLSDPRRDFIKSLCGVLGKNGSIVVYSGFESRTLAELATWMPEFAGRINKIQARLFDLLPVVRNGLYHPSFAGSFSIKTVLPALVPEMTYEGMTIADGQAAGIAWESLLRGGLDQDGQERIEKALLDYCGQDTLALVRLTDKLRFA